MYDSMVKRKGKGKFGISESRSSSKLRALLKTQEINELLEKSTIESEALQNSGDDRPVDESHVLDLLEGGGRYGAGTPKKKRKR